MSAIVGNTGRSGSRWLVVAADVVVLLGLGWFAFSRLRAWRAA